MNDTEKLALIKHHCEVLLASVTFPSNDWGIGYKQCEKDFAEAILNLIEGK
jgi:hypothetical protein